jgi:SAM-dependent methyltransferase
MKEQVSWIRIMRNSKYQHYEKKYAEADLDVSPWFTKQFSYLLKNYAPEMLANPYRCTVLDLGGGTGEYAQKIKELGFKVTVFDFSRQACQKAEAKGLETIHGDFFTFDFGTSSYDIILAKGFSPLNTDNHEIFLGLWEKVRRLRQPSGMSIYWWNTDLSGTWGEGGCYKLSNRDIANLFDGADFLLFPAFRYQVNLPHFINQAISSMILRKNKLWRVVNCIAIEKG